MTMNELKQLRRLRHEIAEDQRRLKELEQMAASPSSPNLTGAPSGSGNKIENAVAEMYDLQQLIRDKIRRLTAERVRLEVWIAGVPDTYIRQIIELYYVDGYSWNRVAMKLHGTTADACRMAVKRYMRSLQNETAADSSALTEAELDEELARYELMELLNDDEGT